MKATEVLPHPPAATVPARPERPGLLDLRAFILLASSLGVAIATGLIAGMYAAHQAESEKVLIGIVSAFAAGVPAFLATAAGLDAIIKP